MPTPDTLAEANRIGLNAATALRQCHDETGINLTDWPEPRALVEAYTGPLHPEGRLEHAARSYVVGLPAVVTVYPDGRVTIEVDTSEADSAILDDDSLDTDYAYEAALDDRVTIGDAHTARTIALTAARPRGA